MKSPVTTCALFLLSVCLGATTPAIGSSVAAVDTDELSALTDKQHMAEARRSKMLDDMRKRGAKWFKSASPATVREYVSIITARWAKHDDQSSLTDLNRFLNAHPTFEPAYGQRASILGRRNLYEAALKDCNVALAMDPEDVQARRTRVYCYLEMKKYDDGIKDADILLAENPYDVHLLLDRAKAYGALGEKAKSDHDLVEAGRVGPYCIVSPMTMMRTQKEQEQQIATLNYKLLRKKDPVMFLERADLFIMTGRFNDAMEDLEEANHSDLTLIQQAHLHFSRARCFAAQKKIDNALAELDRAIAIFENHGKAPGNWTKCRVEDAIMLRADIYYVERKYPECVLSCATYIKYYPDRTAGFVKRADAYVAMNKFPQAMADYRKALEINADEEHAILSLAELCERLHDSKSAIQYYGQLIALHPDVPDFLLARARLFKKLGNLPQALEDYNKMVSISGDDPLAYEERAQVQTALGNIAAAQRDFDLAIKVSPEDATRLKEERDKLGKTSSKVP